MQSEKRSGWRKTMRIQISNIATDIFFSTYVFNTSDSSALWQNDLSSIISKIQVFLSVKKFKKVFCTF